MTDRPRPSRAMEEIRCPACGFHPTLAGETDEIRQLPSHCAICSAPMRHRSVVRSPEPRADTGWASWLESRRIERWIWFLFMVGLAVIATIGLVRSA